MSQPDFETARTQAIQAYRTALEAIVAMAETMRHNEARILAQIENLESPAASSTFRPPGDAHAAERARFSESILRLEQANGLIRQALVDLALAEGRSLSDLARQWGISRQQVWKIAQRRSDQDRPDPT